MNEPTLIDRLNAKAELCRADYLPECAALLDEAAKALRLYEQLRPFSLVTGESERLVQAERERAEIELRYDRASKDLELCRQRIAVLTAVAVRAEEYRCTVLMTPEHNTARDELDKALAAAGIGKHSEAIADDHLVVAE